MSQQARTVSRIITAIEQSEGAGARVRRAIGNMSMRRFDPFLMFDHFDSSGDAGFPEHPHKGQETVTMCLSGAIAHEDFTGSKGVLYPGDLQFMTAGRGIVHSEMPLPRKDKAKNVGLQLWVDLPNNLKNSKPRYRDLKEWEVPEVAVQDGKVKVKVISGKSHGVESQKELAYTPVEYYYYTLKKDGNFTQEVQPEFNYFMYVLKGNGLSVNGKSIRQYDTAFFNRDGDTITGEHNGTKNDDTEFVIIGGKILDQEVVQHGPFVAPTKEKIVQAFQDYQYARNGFENIKTWRPLISDSKQITQEMIDGPLNGNLEKRAAEKAAWLKAHKKTVQHDEL